MTMPVRITVTEAREKNQSGKALLICAYDDDNKFKAYHLEGALTWQAFKEKLPAMDKDQEIIFYCA